MFLRGNDWLRPEAKLWITDLIYEVRPQVQRSMLILLYILFSQIAGVDQSRYHFWVNR
jgi:hypothetical protein